MGLAHAAQGAHREAVTYLERAVDMAPLREAYAEDLARSRAALAQSEPG